MTNFSKVEFDVPDLASTYRNYGTPAVKLANTKMIQKINSQYGQIISYWGNIFSIPKGVIIAFVATESGGNANNKPNIYLATGLMSVTPAAAYTAIADWKKEVKTIPIPSQVLSIVKSKVPELLASKVILSTALKNKILSILEKDVNFNVMCGTMFLRWLLERFSNQGLGQLNKTLVGYNAGAYTSALLKDSAGNTISSKMPIDTVTLFTNKRTPLESKSYLQKMLGVDGFLSLIYKDKVIS